MSQRHIITPLKEDHPLVQEVLTTPPANKVLHILKFSEEELQFPVKTALATRNQVVHLPIRVGNEAMIITEDSQALIEMLSVCFLQRRFNETVLVIVKRNAGEFTIPYITHLRSWEDDERESMVDYNHGSGGCSGSCSSCG